jgi:hypothetical protein
MKRITTIGLVLALLLAFGAGTAAAQEQGPQLFAMEYGTVFGYDLNGNTVESGQEYGFLVSLSPQVQAGASFIQGTAALNAEFFRLRYSIAPLAVNIKVGQVGTAPPANFGYAVGGEYTALSNSFQGVSNRLVISADYIVDTTAGAGFDVGIAAIGISFAMGM